MNLKTVNTAALAAELARRRGSARKLLTRRKRLARELAAIDAELAALGQEPATRASGKAAATMTPRRRAKNDLSLGDALAQAMEVRAVVTPAGAAQRLKDSGYKSTARNFGIMVSSALARDERFKRVARGQYERVA